MNDAPLTRDELAAAFAAIGLEKGDSVLVHSSFKSLGPVEGGPETVIDALLDTLGTEGNLMLPTFNYSNPVPQPWFDPAETPGRTGILAELGRRRPGAVRSLHPTHSVAVLGPAARALTEGHLAVRAFGPGSPLDRLAARGGKVLLLGVDHTANSTIHVAEERAGRPKGSWFDTLPEVLVRLPDGSLVLHRYDTSPSCSAAFGAAEELLRAANAVQDLTLRTSRWQALRGADILAVVMAAIREQPESFLCDRPACKPCAGTRTHLRGGPR